ncbi:flagellin [Thioclava dalianensis]|uniref:Flagellin n=1 Tax=Thioclava dalianensis TaxID=1185766 RepID=A0A074TFE6_9RHOB|nr:flagellin [Thioclava dalianensis]KEP70394.1 flagellin [Thioclava dalianensis]SFN31861.1 flagellin [Thioclava dalianensis]
MSSILTNNGAMVALQTLKGINSGLATTQSEISTGKSVASAKDNAAVWAISKVMESDVKGFDGISGSLALGESTVAVARQASETVTDLLTDIKGKIVAAQEENVDRGKIQTDIVALTDQIKSVVGAAQFNGLNLIDGSSSGDMNVLSSLDRDASGNVNASKIQVSRQNLSVTTPVTAQNFATGDLGANAPDYLSGGGTTQSSTNDALTAAATAANGGGTETITVGQVAEGIGYEIVLDGLDIKTADGSTANGTRTFQYVASDSDGTADVTRNLLSQMNSFFSAATDGSYTAVLGANANEITITNNSGTDVDVGLRATSGGTAGSDVSTGGLGALANIDVTSDAGATGALSSIDALIEKATDSAAAFGSAEGRIQTQADFIADLSGSMKAGIGALVDANMEEASARLQALQTQQQLGIQALSIANQQPQNIMSLFR